MRTCCVWAQGVSVQARDDDVNDLIQSTINDPVNQAAVVGHDACERLDRTLATDGNVIVAHTSAATGAVQVRTLPWTEIVEPVKNPEDRHDGWFWRRRWHDTAGVHEQLHPDLGHQPTGIRPSQVNGLPIRWDQLTLAYPPTGSTASLGRARGVRRARLGPDLRALCFRPQGNDLYIAYVSEKKTQKLKPRRVDTAKGRVARAQQEGLL